MDNKFKELIEFIISLIKQSNSENRIYDGRLLTLVFEDIEAIIKLINDFNQSNENELSYEKCDINEINIKFNRNDQRIFYKFDNFLKYFQLEYSTNNFCIIDENNNFYIYYHEDDSIFSSNDQMEHDNNYIINCIYYLKILVFLSNDNTSDSFSTFNDKLNQKIILILPDKGKFEIGYSNNLPKNIPNFNLKYYYNIITNSKSDFFPFLKKEIYDILKTIDMKDRFEHLMINLKTIYENAKDNYDLFLSGISVQSFIDELRVEQLKYFSAFREVLNKIFTYSISIPVSITATILGIINVPKKNPLILSIIIISFLLFTSLSIYYQFYLKKDILILWNDIKSDYKRFIQLEIFNKDYTRKGFKILLRKIKMIINLINMIIMCLILFATIIIIIFIYFLCSIPTEHSQYLKIIIN